MEKYLQVFVRLKKIVTNTLALALIQVVVVILLHKLLAMFR